MKILLTIAFTLTLFTAQSSAQNGGLFDPRKAQEANQQESTGVRVSEGQSQREADKPTFDGVIPSWGPLIPTGEYDAKGEPKMEYLGTRIKEGTVELEDIPYFIIYLIDFMTIAGSIAVAFLIYGGIQLSIAGVTEAKENAKNTIQYALLGVVVTFLAWVIISILQANLTSSAAF